MRQRFQDVFRITAIGGGTVLDAAKAYFCLQQPKHAQLLLIPTTFGTGAEITAFATVYDEQGRKLSLTLPSSVSVSVQYQPDLLHTLPEIELLAGFCDAFAHGFESLWSTRRNQDSILYASASLQLGLKLWKTWDRSILKSHAHHLQNMGRLAGEAIARSKTTAAHALSYEWTQRYDIPHGFAVAASLPSLAMLGDNPLQMQALGLPGRHEVLQLLTELVHFFVPDEYRKKLANAIRQGRLHPPCPDRLRNFPVCIDAEGLRRIDEQTLRTLDTDARPLFILKEKGRSRHSMRTQPPFGPMDPPLA
jgi:alcohol dehydrogenase class IV